MTEEEFLLMLHETKTIDDFTHWEDGQPVTFIATLDQLRTLVEAAYDKGRSDSLEGGV